MTTTRLGLLIGMILLTTATPAQQAMRDQIVAKERQELDSLKTGSYDVFASLLADDAIFVDAHGPADKADVVKNTAEIRLEEYSMEEVKFVPVSPESGLIVYRIIEKGTSHGKPFAAQAYISALWAKRSGKWVCLFSQETAPK